MVSVVHIPGNENTADYLTKLLNENALHESYSKQILKKPVTHFPSKRIIHLNKRFPNV